MKQANTHSRSLVPVLLTTATVIVAVVALAAHGNARSTNTISVTVHNNMQRTIKSLYVAVGDPNNWGPDQLNGATIPSGGQFVLNNVSCNGSTVRLIAEDQSGCFVYDNAACDGNQSWEIPSDATPDCGGN